MARIDRLQGDHYLIPAPQVLEDSMHGTMTIFERLIHFVQTFQHLVVMACFATAFCRILPKYRTI